MPLRASGGASKQWTSWAVVVAAVAFFAIAFGAPLFGWDPIGDGLGHVYDRYPKSTAAAVLGLLGYTLWRDVTNFRVSGDRAVVWRLYAYGLAILFAVIVFVGAVLKNGI